MLTFEGTAVRKYVPSVGFVYLCDSTPQVILAAAKAANIPGVVELPNKPEPITTNRRKKKDEQPDEPIVSENEVAEYNEITEITEIENEESI